MSSAITSWKRSPLPSITGQEDNIPSRIESGSPSHAVPQADARLLSTSVSSASYREPTRSFIPGTARDHLSKSTGHIDSASYARNVRADTAELASYVLSDTKEKRRASFLNTRLPESTEYGLSPSFSQHDSTSTCEGVEAIRNDTIEEVSEPITPDTLSEDVPDEGPSILASMLKHSPPSEESESDSRRREIHAREPGKSGIGMAAGVTQDPQGQRPDQGKNLELNLNERTPLLPTAYRDHPPPESPDDLSDPEEVADIEAGKVIAGPWNRSYFRGKSSAKGRIYEVMRNASPEKWNRGSIFQHIIMAPVRCLPAVIVGLLLNILDALSYGMILFPLGNPIFAELGPTGISIFYISTIISQLTFSCGSIFRGGVGSELIEVVPFFHSMAATITDIVGKDSPDAVIATTITAFALSSMLTGIVFYLMGRFRLGYIIGFIPRHILIGCIGGVGFFLLRTAIEVSARLGEFGYDLETGRRLIQLDTLPLWMIPLGLAALLFALQRKFTSQYFLSVYILAIPLVFYIIVISVDSIQPDNLRKTGWIFEAPREDQPWWYFWTLYKFNLVHWGAILETSGAMFALTFFSLLHVPINVPALAQSTGEDNADLNHELKLHGCSNFLSGLAGSIQNYLVYANTLFFMRSGGNNRLAGFMLAAFTAAVMVIGPVIIGYIPVMMVGTLIFVLGFELLCDALIAPRNKLKFLEYLTIIAIVLTMGIYDFVAGIFLGLILAFVSVVVHQSTNSAIRATYTGAQVGSMVRRNPSQYHYLQEVGSQTYIIKLCGFLFFGNIVGVREKIQALIAHDVFVQHPIRFIILDLSLVSGLDYSGAEGFMLISRLLHKKGITLLISGQDAESKIGRELRAVGLGEDDIEVSFMPDLNSSLEASENLQLRMLYREQEQEALRTASRHAASSPSSLPSHNLDVPKGRQRSNSTLEATLSQSPRRNHLQEAARHVLAEHETQRPSRWHGMSEPLRLMLQIFHGLSDKNEDFWFRATTFFKRQSYPAGTILYRIGDPAKAFYLLERGELRADYETPQGRLSEPIMQGTACGELPFFSQTERTATVSAVKDCVVWAMDTKSWERLRQEQNEVYQELLTVSLKLTKERMSAMTNYMLANAS